MKLDGDWVAGLLALAVFGAALGLSPGPGQAAPKNPKYAPPECVPNSVYCDRTWVSWTRTRYKHGVLSGRLMNRKECRGGRSIMIDRFLGPPIGPIKTRADGTFQVELDLYTYPDFAADHPDDPGVQMGLQPNPDYYGAVASNRNVVIKKVKRSKQGRRTKRTSLQCRGTHAPGYEHSTAVYVVQPAP